jgi:uncharacterized membrane protein
VYPAPARRDITDDTELVRLQHILAVVLRSGVLISAALIAAGIVLFMIVSGPRAVLFAPRIIPPGSETDPRSLRAVLDALIPAQPAAVTDLGLLMLLATPVLSVAVAIVIFIEARDLLYVGISTFVLAMLILGFLIGAA